MRIITNLKALDLDQDAVEVLRDKENSEPITELLHDVFQTLSSAFNDCATDPECYLYDAREENNFLIGARDPEKLVNAAKEWNQEIREAFASALKGLDALSIPTELLPIDNSATYAMACAARELDNCWWAYASHATFLPNSMGYPYFQCSLDDKTLKDIIANPEQYMIVEVYVK